MAAGPQPAHYGRGPSPSMAELSPVLVEEHHLMTRTSSEPPVRRPHILLVDDQVTLGRIIRLVLERKAEATVTYIADSRAALALLQTQRFDLLITDYRMPEVNGLQLAEKARHCDPDIGILVITGYPTPELRDAVRCLGACRMMRKPFSLAAIQEAVAALLPKGRSQ